MIFNYLETRSPILDVFVYASAGITIASSLHYITHAARIVNQQMTRAASSESSGGATGQPVAGTDVRLTRRRPV